MNAHDGQVVHVVRTADSEIEIFSSADQAWQYARSKRGATVLERAVRDSVGEAQIVYERRVHIVDGVVRRDVTTDEPFFTIGADSWITAAEVESFEAKDDRWTIVGLGTDRARLDEMIEREVSRLTAAALWSRQHLA